MKRGLTILIPGILFLIGGYLFYEPLIIIFQDGKMLTSFIVITTLLIILLVGIFIFISYSQRKKIDKLNNRLGMWTKLSYHVNQVGDEIFNELPIGILAYDDDFEIKWINNYSNVIFNKNLINL